MRLVCSTIEDFITNIDNGDGLLGTTPHQIFKNKIWCSIVRRAQDNETLQDSARVEVLLQAAAVIVFDAESESLIEVGISCGMDYPGEDEPDSRAGSEQAAALKQQLTDYADERGFVVLPGVIDM